jgi:carbohydrate-selective porin OprB
MLSGLFKSRRGAPNGDEAKALKASAHYFAMADSPVGGAIAQLRELRESGVLNDAEYAAEVSATLAGRRNK